MRVVTVTGDRVLINCVFNKERVVVGKKFVLIEVIEREINNPEFFDTYEEAYSKM